VFGRLKGRFRYVEPAFRVNRSRSHDPRRGKGGGTSDNWSGGVVYAAGGQSFRSVQGSWVVPNVYPATSSSEWYYFSSWIGLDGDGSATSYGFTAPPGKQLLGLSAEWIVEMPWIASDGSTLPDYGEVFFSFWEAHTDQTTVEGGTGDNINLVYPYGGQKEKVISQATLITPTIIQCAYSGT
jgi:peptidase A4-like protein